MRTFISIALNLGTVAVALLAVNGFYGFERILILVSALNLFAGAVLVPLTVIYSVVSPDKFNQCKVATSKSRKAVARLSDFSVMCIAAWAGWWWICAIFAFGYIAQEILWALNEKENTP